ncbi:MAG: hypothetical protein H7301_07945 [Cryobacterium sp.]|nr:hypothetical protein [Oligoflexia bacterium]
MADDAVYGALTSCLSKYLIPDLPGRTLKRVIKVTLNRELYAADIAPVVMTNSAYTQFVLKIDFLQPRIKEWLSEMPEGQVNYRIILERIFILLGKQASRNLVAAIRLSRLGNQLPRKKNDRFSVNPKEQLKHALICEEFCEEKNYASSELAFLAGLQYDLLLTNFQKLKVSRSTLESFSLHFPESLKTAHIAYEIASRMGAFPFIEYAFPAAMTLGVGKVLAHAIYPKEGSAPSYAAFLAEIEKKTVMKWQYASLEEHKRFPLHLFEMSALAAQNYGFFKPIEPAIRFARESYYLKHSQPTLYPLALLLGIAESSAIGRPLRKTDSDGLVSLKINPAIIAQALSAVAAQGKKS